QLPELPALPDDAGVVLDVRGGGYGVEQLRQEHRPADVLFVAARPELFVDSHRVDLVAAAEQAQHGPVDAAVLLPVEHLLPDDVDDLRKRLRVDQYGAQDADLGLRRPGRRGESVFGLLRSPRHDASALRRISPMAVGPPNMPAA